MSKKRRWRVDVARRADTDAIMKHAKESGLVMEPPAAEIVIHKWRSVYPELEDLQQESREWLRSRSLFVPENEQDLNRRAGSAARALAARDKMQRAGKKARLPIVARDFEDAIRRLLPAGTDADSANLGPEGPPMASAEGFKVGYSLDAAEHHFSISRQDQARVPRSEQEEVAKRISAVVGKEVKQVFQGLNPAVFHVLIHKEEE